MTILSSYADPDRIVRACFHRDVTGESQARAKLCIRKTHGCQAPLKPATITVNRVGAKITGCHRQLSQICPDCHRRIKRIQPQIHSGKIAGRDAFECHLRAATLFKKTFGVPLIQWSGRQDRATVNINDTAPPRVSTAATIFSARPDDPNPMPKL